MVRYLLRRVQLTLVCAQDPQVVDGVQCGRVIEAQRVLTPASASEYC